MCLGSHSDWWYTMRCDGIGSLLTQMRLVVVSHLGLLVNEDCHFHHERKRTQLVKNPKWK